MFKITYEIIDHAEAKYSGQFVTYSKKAAHITHKICDKHPKILLPFKSHNIKVRKA